MDGHPTAELFADGISDISFAAGIVRIDLYSHSSTEKDKDGNPVPAFRQRVVMSPQAFMDSFATMQNMMNKFEEAGLIRRNQAGEAKAATSGADDKKAESGDTPTSPNF